MNKAGVVLRGLLLQLCLRQQRSVRARRARHSSFRGDENVEEWDESAGPNRPQHSQRRASTFLQKIGSRNERSGHDGAIAFLRTHDVQRRKKIWSRRLGQSDGGSGAANMRTPRKTSPSIRLVSASALNLIFDIEADRIQNLSFDPKKIASEREVVASERRTSVDANNEGLLDEQLWATAYIAHPYQWPVVADERHRALTMDTSSITSKWAISKQRDDGCGG